MRVWTGMRRKVTGKDRCKQKRKSKQKMRVDPGDKAIVALLLSVLLLLFHIRFLIHQSAHVFLRSKRSCKKLSEEVAQRILHASNPYTIMQLRLQHEGFNVNKRRGNINRAASALPDTDNPVGNSEQPMSVVSRLAD